MCNKGSTLAGVDTPQSLLDVFIANEEEDDDEDGW